MAKLTALKVKALREPGRYGDSGGLYLVIRPTGSKSWVQRAVVDGRRRDIGVGGYPTISLAKARERAAANRTAVADGKDPRADKPPADATDVSGRSAERYIEANSSLVGGILRPRSTGMGRYRHMPIPSLAM